MKRLGPFVLFLILSVTVFSQEVEKRVYKYYRLYETSNLLGGNVRVIVDDGDTNEVLLDEKGNSFRYVLKAVNYIAKVRNSELMQIHTEVSSNGVETVYYFMKEEIIQ